MLAIRVKDAHDFAQLSEFQFNPRARLALGFQRPDVRKLPPILDADNGEAQPLQGFGELWPP
jgi:hypothetical protein